MVTSKGLPVSFALAIAKSSIVTMPEIIDLLILEDFL
jgi:hypothetical protein